MILTRLRDWATRFSRSSRQRHSADSFVRTTEYEGYARYARLTSPDFFTPIKYGDIDYIKITKETKYQGRKELGSHYQIVVYDYNPPLVYDTETNWRADWIPVEICRRSQAYGLAY